jgi:hypothetical protein
MSFRRCNTHADRGNQCGMSCRATFRCAENCCQPGNDRRTKRAVLICGLSTAMPQTTSSTACTWAGEQFEMPASNSCFPLATASPSASACGAGRLELAGVMSCGADRPRRSCAMCWRRTSSPSRSRHHASSALRARAELVLHLSAPPSLPSAPPPPPARPLPCTTSCGSHPQPAIGSTTPSTRPCCHASSCSAKRFTCEAFPPATCACGHPGARRADRGAAVAGRLPRLGSLQRTSARGSTGAGR